MKQLILAAVLLAGLSSCATIHRAKVDVTKVRHPEIETTTMATLEVMPEKISYKYTPSKSQAKSLGRDQLISNAIFEALEVNGNADVLVSLNTYIVSRGRVKSVIVSGYPAYYRDFREPTMEEVEKIEKLSRTETNSRKTNKIFLKK